jgi:signal recognition particle receptor subunit beta
LEVIELIKKTKIPVIIAINKIDLPMANPLEVEMEL